MTASTTTSRSNSMITDERMEKALNFLATTDTEYAEWCGAVMRSDFMMEAAEALAFKASEATSAEARKQDAKLSEAVKKAQEEHIKCVVNRERLRAQRKRAELTIEVWRSMNANRRVGNVT